MVRRRSHRGALVVVTVVFMALAAPCAEAATVSVVGSTLTFTAAAGEANDLTIDRPIDGAGSFVVTDSGATVSRGAGCAAGANSHQAVCSPAGVSGITISLGDLDDEVAVTAGCAPDVWCPSTIVAGAGADTITAGLGLDVVDGGPGGDLFLDTIGWGTIDYSSRTAPVSVTEDGVANDGEAGEGDNVAGSFSLIGGSGADTFSTDLNVVTLEGREGNDSLSGSGTLRGQNGNDTISPISFFVTTTAEGGDGADTINGEGNLFGDGGADTITGGPAIFGGDDNDTLTAGGANPCTIQPGLGSDVVNAGDADTWVSYEERSNAVTVKLDGLANDGESGEADNVAPGIVGVILGSGNDLAEGSSGYNIIDGRAGNDTIRGFGSGDGLTGGSGSDVLEGGTGDDAFDGGEGGTEIWGGADDIHGGDGNDTAYYQGHTADVHVDFDDLADDGQAGEDDNVHSDVESAVGGLGNDTLIGNGVANHFDGGPGNDDLVGNGENDFLIGGFNDDSIDGGAGDDVLSGMDGDDELDGGSGADQIFSGNGTDFVDYSGRTGNVTVTSGGSADDGEPGEGDDVSIDFEKITTGSGNDNITCGFFGCLASLGSGNDHLTGGLGPVTVLGGPGNDVLTGGDSGDTFVGEPGSDEMHGGAGTDSLDYSARTDAVSVSFNDTPDDGSLGEGDNVGSDIEVLTTGSGNDSFLLDAGSTQINAGDGADMIDGGLGADIVNAGNGVDTIDYSSRTADLRVDLATNFFGDGELTEGDSVGDSVERVLAGSGNDQLRGSSANNFLDGAAGDDVLDGRAGADEMIGGDGHDLVDYTDRTADVSVDLDGSPGDDGEFGEGDTVGANVEDVSTGTGDDSLVGNAADNFFKPGLGADGISGGAGVDTVDYHTRSKNLLLALDGNANDGVNGEHDNVAPDLEVLLAGSGDDVILGNVGSQTFSGGKGDDFLDGGFGDDHLLGGPGFDAAGYGARTNSVSASLADGANNGEDGEKDLLDEIEALVGGHASDELTGDAANNTLVGGSGADRLVGKGGKDYLLGEGGSDSLAGGDAKDFLDGGLGGDVIAGGAKFDVVDYSQRHARVRVDLGGGRDDGQRGEHDNVHSDVEGLLGGHAGDMLTGNGAGNGIAGGPGDDTVVGGGGADGLFGEAGSDRILARDGRRDFLSGGKGHDRASFDSGLDIVRSIEASARPLSGRADSGARSGAWAERLQLVGARLHDAHVRLGRFLPSAWKIPEGL